MFYIKIDSDEPFDFKSGQFVTLDLPVSEKRQQRWKSYSIANNQMKIISSNYVFHCILMDWDQGISLKWLPLARK